MEPHSHIGHAQSGSGAGVSLTTEERLQHLAILGATGVGKSTLLLNLLAQDIARGDGLLLIDPHGDLAEAALRYVPPQRHNQVCYLNLADAEYPVGLNVLEDARPDERALVVDGVVAAMRSIWRDSWGPRLEQILRHAAAALLETPNASLVLLPRLLTDDDFRRRVTARVTNPLTRSFFGDRFDNWRDTYRDEAIDPVLNKVDAFLFSPAIRNVLGQARSTLHFDHAMRHGRIIVANLAKGLVGETAANLAGALALARVQAAGLARARQEPKDRHPFHVIVDEAQNFGTGAVNVLLSETRKYGVSLTIATQYLAALGETTRAALLGNVGTLVAFRVGVEDAAHLAPHFDRLHQRFNPHALLELGRGEAFVRSGSADSARVTITPPPVRDGGDPELVIKQSRRHYGRPRAEVEIKIVNALGFSGRHKLRSRPG